MKKTKIFAAIGGLGLAVLSVFLIAADHVDAPDVEGMSTDIADLYAFEGDNADNTVFIATVQGPLEPGAVTTNAKFAENVMIEFNIDNSGDFVEDLVIQAIPRGDYMFFFGPYLPGQTGLNSTINTDNLLGSVQISTTSDDYTTTTDSGASLYAGPRRDMFFFDFNQFNTVIAGGDANGFKQADEASDFFANSNVLAVVVEIPNSLLGPAPAHVGGVVGITGLPNAYNVWVTTKKK